MTQDPMIRKFDLSFYFGKTPSVDNEYLASFSISVAMVGEYVPFFESI